MLAGFLGKLWVDAVLAVVQELLQELKRESMAGGGSKRGCRNQTVNHMHGCSYNMYTSCFSRGSQVKSYMFGQLCAHEAALTEFQRVHFNISIACRRRTRNDDLTV